MDRPRIAIIGSGNVATHLALSLDVKADVVQVVSRRLEHAQRLAGQMREAIASDSVSDLIADADFYIISVNDDAILSVVSQMPQTSGAVMHTSGSVSIDVLRPASSKIGVFYPLQTFSRTANVNMQDVPFFLEASDSETLAKIEMLARSVSSNVYYADSSQRTILHIAAVFGCNFFNHLLSISAELLKSGGYELDVLRPLLEVTLAKAMDMGPHAAQTGPAVRADYTVMEKHMQALTGSQREIYALLSADIMKAAGK